VAEELGNTAAICRKCYIHPTVLAAFQNRALHKLWRSVSARPASRRGLSKEESALLGFLRACSGRSLESLLRDSLSPPSRGAAKRR
jgi:DNA topoisomerase-1